MIFSMMIGKALQRKEPTFAFPGQSGFLWLTVGFLLLAAGIGRAIYIVAHLLNYL
jgi:hypothetical protein